MEDWELSWWVFLSRSVPRDIGGVAWSLSLVMGLVKVADLGL